MRDSIKKIPFPDIDGAFIIISAHEFLDEHKRPRGNGCEPTLSFVYINGDYAAEWEPQYGPISTIQKADADAEGVRECYIFGHRVDSPLNWSQLAVEDMGLPRAFLRGHYEFIFDVLRSWVEDR